MSVCLRIIAVSVRAATLFATIACSKTAVTAVEPVVVADAHVATPDVATGADAAVGGSTDGGSDSDTKVSPGVGGAFGGLWVRDANGAPVGVLVQRGHASLSLGGAIDVLRDGVIVYSPQFAVFFGVQMSSGIVINPRLGVVDTGCAEPITAGYYTDGDAISGQGMAFVYNSSWYRIAEYKPLQLVTCGGTVPDGVSPKCSPHNGSCRGFPVTKMLTSLPLQFVAPLQFAWVAP